MNKNKRNVSQKNDTNIFLRALSGSVKMFLCTIGVICLFGALLGAINSTSEKNMYDAFGWGGILITGFFGTPIHEFSHWIMCKIFFIPVYDVNFFRPIDAQSDGVLGYVEYGEVGIIRQAACFFVGFAPIIIGTIVIVLLFKLLVPTAFKELNDEIDMIMSDDKLSFNLVFRIVGEVVKSIFKIPLEEGAMVIGKYIAFLLLMFSVSSHMVLSKADLQNSYVGMFVIFVIMYIICLILEDLRKKYRKGLYRTTIIISSFFSVAVVFSLISLMISYIINLMFG